MRTDSPAVATKADRHRRRQPAPVAAGHVAPRGARNRTAGKYVLLMRLAVFFAGPFVWLVLAALKTQPEWVSIPTHMRPRSPQWNNFVQAFTGINFPAYTVNSLFLSTLYAVLVTLSSAAVGFGFARLDAPGKQVLFGILLSTMMLPQMMTLFPTYVMFAKVGMVEHLLAVGAVGVSAAPVSGVPVPAVLRRRCRGSWRRRRSSTAAATAGSSWRIFLPLSGRCCDRVPAVVHLDLGRLHRPALLLDIDRTTLSVAIAAGTSTRTATRSPPCRPPARPSMRPAGVADLPVRPALLHPQRRVLRRQGLSRRCPPTR